MARNSAVILMNATVKMSASSIKSVPILMEATTVTVSKVMSGTFQLINKLLLSVSILTSVKPIPVLARLTVKILLDPTVVSVNLDMSFQQTNV